MLQYDAVTRAAEMQRKEDDDAYALLQRHSPSTPVTKAGKRDEIIRWPVRTHAPHTRSAVCFVCHLSRSHSAECYFKKTTTFLHASVISLSRVFYSSSSLEYK